MSGSTANGDVNMCLIKTANGRSIAIKHDTDLPRPYSRRNLVQGTRGIIRGFPQLQVCFEDDSHRHRWESGEEYIKSHQHPLWKTLRDDSLGVFNDAESGLITGGAVWEYEPSREIRSGDFLEDYRLIQALRTGAPPDCDVIRRGDMECCGAAQ